MGKTVPNLGMALRIRDDIYIYIYSPYLVPTRTFLTFTLVPLSFECGLVRHTG